MKEEKVGLLICHCGTNIAGTVDIEWLVEYFSRKKNIIVKEHKHACTDDGLNTLRRMIREDDVNRIVIAACTPFLHGGLFRRIAEEEGVNRGFVEIVNIREQCSWPHYGLKKKATLKARDLIEMGIAKVMEATPMRTLRTPVTRRILVIGGGVSGVMASLLAADMGFDVILVEKEPVLGGNMAKLDKLFPTLDCAPCILGPLLAQVYNHPRIKVLTLSEVEKVSGRPGDFMVRIKRKPRYIDEDKCVSGCTLCIDACPITVPDEYNGGLSTRKAVWRPTPVSVPNAPFIDMNSCIGCMSCVGACDREAINLLQREEIVEERVGAIIVACGMKPFNPERAHLYGYLRYKNVITSLEYEWLINSMGPTGGELIRLDNGEKPKSICFIQCVGSRSEKDHEYCSSACCLNTIKLAVNTKLRYPEINITIFYTDIRAMGAYGEELYRKALDMGIRFVRARVSRVEKNRDKLLVLYEDTLSGKAIEEHYDMVVLAVGIEPSEGLDELARRLGLSLDAHGFLQVYHPKLYPSDTFVTGIYVAGTCTGPKDITESVEQAGLAVARAAGLLQSGEVEIEDISAKIDYEKCTGCGTCYAACTFNAISFKNGKPVVDGMSCKGCGACMAWCPSEAISLPGLTINSLRAQLKALFSLEKAESPIIPAFVCRWCGYAALDNAGVSKIRYPTNIRPILVPCSIAVPPRLVLEAFTLGADGVLVIGCHEQDCHYRTGSPRFKKLALEVKRILEENGVNPGRFEFIETSAGEGKRVAEEIAGFVERIKTLGPMGSEAGGEVK